MHETWNEQGEAIFSFFCSFTNAILFLFSQIAYYGNDINFKSNSVSFNFNTEVRQREIANEIKLNEINEGGQNENEQFFFTRTIKYYYHYYYL